MTTRWQVTLNCDQMEIVMNALAIYMERQAGLAQVDEERAPEGFEALHNLVVEEETEQGIDAADIGAMHSAVYVDTRRLRGHLVEIVGRDLTVEGC